MDLEYVVDSEFGIAIFSFCPVAVAMMVFLLYIVPLAVDQ